MLFLLAGLWGSSYLFTRMGLESLPPTTLVALRVSIAAMILLAVVWRQGYRLPRSARDWGNLVIQSFLNSFGAWTMVAWGQQYVDSGLAAVLNSTSPIFVFLITWLITRHETVTALKVTGAITGLAGVIMIIGVDALESLGQQVVAQLVILFAAMLFGYAAIRGKNFAHLPPTVTAAGVMIVASAVLVPASLIIDRPWTLEPTLRSLAAVSMLGTFGTGVALLLYFRLINTLGSLNAASQSYLRMGVGVLLGMVIYGEQLTLTVAIGVLIAIIGVALINMPTRKS
ncbi:DMT family transporter [Sneathiella sp.]|uniref:DMT family transporter n=1 Tax=Sneathiella sp. TaxID=1964365 RepID=UPI002FE1F79A